MIDLTEYYQIPYTGVEDMAYAMTVLPELAANNRTAVSRGTWQVIKSLLSLTDPIAPQEIFC